MPDCLLRQARQVTHWKICLPLSDILKIDDTVCMCCARRGEVVRQGSKLRLFALVSNFTRIDRGIT
jgi:hypothetical protein